MRTLGHALTATVIAALLLAACGSTEDPAGDSAATPDAAREPSPVAPSPSEEVAPADAGDDDAAEDEDEAGDAAAAGLAPDVLDVEIECLRGDTLQELPYDPDQAQLVGIDPADDTRWVVHTLTMTSRHDAPVQVAPEFPVDLLAADGSVIATGTYYVAPEVLLHVPAGETVQRRQTSFEGATGLLGLTAEEWPAAYGAVADCAVGDLTLSEAEPLTVDPALTVEEDLCTISDDGTAVVALWFVENTGATDVTGAPLLAVRDGAGTIVASGLGIETTITAGSTFQISAGVARQDLPDVDADVRCGLVTLVPGDG